MGKSRLSPSLRQTSLGVHVRDHRERLKLTQAEFQKRIGYEKPQYQSKIEQGSVVTPDPKYLEASREMRISVEDLERMHTVLAEALTPSPSLAHHVSANSAAGKPLIYFGHCLWGAPLYLAINKGLCDRFEVASLGKEDSNDAGRLLSPTPIAAFKNFRSPASMADDLLTMSASTVLEALQADEIIAGALPGNLLADEDYQEELVSLATLVDSSAGCTLVCDKQTLVEKLGSKSEALDVWEDAQQSPDGPLNNVSLGTRQLGVILNSLLLSQQEKEAIKIGLETNTIAEQFLRDACRHATELRESDTTNLTPGTPFKIHHRRLVWHFRNQELKKKGFEELKNECCSKGEENGPVTRQLLGVITWEPHATWLASRSKNLVKVALNFSPDALGRPKHLSFDIVVSRASFLRSVETNRALRADFIEPDPRRLADGEEAEQPN